MSTGTTMDTSASGSGSTASSTQGSGGSESGADGVTDLPELIGEWRSVDPLVPGAPDLLTVIGDGNAMATFGYDDGGTPATVEEGGYFVADGNAQRITFECGAGCTLGFEVVCALVGELLHCGPAPEWYHLDQIVYTRVS